MKSKKQRKTHLQVFFSLLLTLCIVFSSFPTYAVSTDIEHFIGLDDLEAEEGTRLNLLENVSAYDADNESLEVTVTSVTSQDDSGFVYDSSNFLTVGSAGSEYVVEYSATSSDGNVAYTGSRRVTSIGSQEEVVPETEDFSDGETLPESERIPEEEKPLDEGQTPEAESIPESKRIPEAKNSLETEETTQSENTEFDETQPFTIAQLKAQGYSVQMDGAEIPIKHFELECLPLIGESASCKDLRWIEPPKIIEGGKIQDHVPFYVENQKQQKHSFLKAHVGNVNVYYIGKLHIYDGQDELDYIYYTTDKEITNKTVYAVLKENEKIKLQYKHDSDYEVNYKIINEITKQEETIGGWTVDDVFGVDRAYSVKKNDELSVKIKIPRGYVAEVYYTEENDSEEHLKSKLGEMMAFQRDKKKPNQIVLQEDSPSGMVYKTSFNLQGITNNITIKLRFKQVEEIKFDAYMWSQTAFTKGRIQVHPNETPNEQNTKKVILMPKNTDGASFTWEWDGVTSKGGDNPMIDQGNGQDEFHTWELDQLEINDETVLVPMIPLNEVDETKVQTTVLNSGTVVTLSVTSKGGENGYKGRRHYKLEVSNCYEDITISGGNMVAHRHKEYVIHELSGVFQPGYYAATEFNGGESSWNEMLPDTKIAKRGFDEKNKWTDPFRFQRHVGFYKPEITFTMKDGSILQKNDAVGDIDPDGDKKEYIQYLKRIDVDTKDDKVEGEYKIVSYQDWEPSADGYYYFRGSDEVKEFVGDRPEDAYKGVVLININAYPLRIGLDYQNGADPMGEKAPKEEDIVNLPHTQYGGKEGYNALSNPQLLMSNQVPVDQANQFIFDHWEVLRTESNDTPEGKWGYVTDQVKTEGNIPVEDGGKPFIAYKGEEFYLDAELLKTMEDCLYLQADPDSGHEGGNPFDDQPHKGAQTYAMVTVRAVWREYKEEPTIPYIVRYVLADVNNGQIDTTTEKLIEQRAHTVNKGAKLVTDLYQDRNKTLSASIQNILKGENTKKKDYTERGKISWLVYEPKTTKVIESVDEHNHIATIYLIRENKKINVEKKWASRNHKERKVEVQLQRRKTDNDSWEAVENKTISLFTNWKHSFYADQYYDLSQEPFKFWQYRVVELNDKKEVIENGQNLITNGNDYQVGYQYNEKTDTWIITNTKLLDVSISKVVEGKMGDRSKEFQFNIKALDSSGKELEGQYRYFGKLKPEYENQTQIPSDGMLTFQNGKASISLKHGQQIVIDQLPVNATIIVEEQLADGYETSYKVNGEKKDIGEVILTTHSSIDVVNQKKEIPATGITHDSTGIGVGVGIITIGILAFGGVTLLRWRKGKRK